MLRTVVIHPTWSVDRVVRDRVNQSSTPGEQMFESTAPRAIADVSAVVPTQRIALDERAATLERDVALPAGEDLTVELPNLAATLAAVPGGLGAEMVKSFTFAGQRWTVDDALVTGTPIGLQLAMEQRGLDV